MELRTAAAEFSNRRFSSSFAPPATIRETGSGLGGGSHPIEVGHCHRQQDPNNRNHNEDFD